MNHVCCELIVAQKCLFLRLSSSPEPLSCGRHFSSVVSAFKKPAAHVLVFSQKDTKVLRRRQTKGLGEQEMESCWMGNREGGKERDQEGMRKGEGEQRERRRRIVGGGDALHSDLVFVASGSQSRRRMWKQSSAKCFPITSSVKAWPCFPNSHWL